MKVYYQHMDELLGRIQAILKIKKKFLLDKFSHSIGTTFLILETSEKA